jgi:hypothetical protein
MWLYLPPSVSARDTQESNSDYQPWETLSQSATWKTTRRRPQFWQREWEKDSSLRLLSGVTLPPLTADRGVALWTSWLADSRVPHSQSQASTSERTTPETSGPMLPDSHLNSDIQLSFSKMLTESSNTTTSLSDQSYRQWATGLRKDSTRRRKQALRTAGSDYSLWLSTERIRAFWPSPAQRDWKGSPGTTEFRNGRFIRTSDSTGTEYGAGLDGAAVNWRTPGANDANGGIEDWNSEHFKSITAPRIKLNHQAANWATVRVSSANGPSQSELGNSNSEGLQGRGECRYSAREQPPREAGTQYLPLYPPGPEDTEGWAYMLGEMPASKPSICFLVDGRPPQLERVIRSYGNGVVPAVAAIAWCDLAQTIIQEVNMIG